MKQKANTQNMILLAIVALFWFAQYVYIPYQTTYLTAAGAAGNVVGIVVGAYGISQLVLRLPAGVCADRLGRHKPFIMTGAAAAGAASLFRVFLCDERGFMAGNLLSGLASAMWISFMVFYTGKFGKEDQQRATSRIVLFNNLGMLLGFIASTLCYSRIGMRNLCLFSVAAGAAAFCLALQVLPGMATGILFSYATSEAMKGVPEEKRFTAMGFFQAVYAIGMTAFPMFTGSIVSAGGMEAGYLVLAGIAAAGIIIAKVYYHREKGRDR